jgi:small subunit ribosomal protein S1
MMEIADGHASVELGEGIRASCRLEVKTPAVEKESRALSPSSKPDLSSLGSMLQARWKGNAPASNPRPEPLHSGQVRNFQITKLDPAAKKIELKLA